MASEDNYRGSHGPVTRTSVTSTPGTKVAEKSGSPAATGARSGTGQAAAPARKQKADTH